MSMSVRPREQQGDSEYKRPMSKDASGTPHFAARY